jgi:hypothetical protein
MPMLDASTIDDALDETIDDFAAYMGRLFTDDIRQPKWPWPRDPSPRDIVKSGNLAKSLRIIRASGIDGNPEVMWQWTAPYAAPVHDGAVFKRTDAEGNPVTMPARPWTRPVLYDRVTIQSYISRRFALALRRRVSA